VKKPIKLTFRIEEEDYNEMLEASERIDVSVSWIIRSAIKRLLKTMREARGKQDLIKKG